MENYTIIQALKSLNKAELREFGRFVASPYYNGRKEVTKFFNELKKFYPDFSHKNFKADKIFYLIYAKKPYRKDNLRKLASFLLKLYEKFLSVNSVNKDDFYYSHSMLVELLIKNIHPLFSKHLNTQSNELEKLKGEAEFFYWKKDLIERMHNSHYMLSGNDHLAGSSILKRADYFAYHSVLVMSKILISLVINEKNFNSDYSRTDYYELFRRCNFEDFVNYLEESRSPHYHVIAVYFYEAMALMNTESDVYFNKLKNLLLKNTGNFSYSDRINLYTVFEAICTLKTERGDFSVQKELFETYKYMLQKKLFSFTEGGEFIVKLFRNFILIGIQLREFKWLENFIAQYSKTLPADSRDNMIHLSEAMLLFEKKEFEKSLSILSKINYEIFHFKIDIKNLQLKIYYELNLFNEAYSLIDSYKRFITGNKFVSERYKTMAGNFVDYAFKLLKAKESINPEIIYSIKKELEDKRNILNSDWLVEKAGEI